MAYEFTYGSGTEADPYLVETAADLNGVRDYLSAHFKQMADIDLSGYENWEPIGIDDTPFGGIYDGNSKKVSNLVITQVTPHAPTGLFGYTSNAVISNLTVIGQLTEKKI